VAGTFGVQAADWELTEDGKHWMYLYSPDDPAKDEWIEDNEKLYYVDSKGYMKTGWVTSQYDGKKYYMGPDGAMQFNTFAKDGRYVGPDGTGLDGYDKYRKAVKKELKKAAPKKSKGKAEASSDPQITQFFALEDLNMDGYRDLIIMTGQHEAQSLQEVAVWMPEEEKFQLAAEFDTPDSGQQGTLYLDPEGEEVWLELTEKSGDMRLFQMSYGKSVFENIWVFTMEKDDEGYPQYYINGDLEDRQTWELLMQQARQKRGGISLSGYVPATEENISAQVDVILSEADVDLWK